MNPLNKPPKDVFWLDARNPYQQKETLESPMVNMLSRFVQLFVLIVALSFFPLLIDFQNPFSWGCTLFVLVVVGVQIYVYRQQTGFSDKAVKTQQKAKETIGADIIDSAIHVAGHPLLERDQPVVLALKRDELSIFSYEDSRPIVVYSVRDFQSVHTVVYDDERVPHLDVIDSAAQALQVNFAIDGEAFSALFRRMLKVRPIDWYHAIQKARLDKKP